MAVDERILALARRRRKDALEALLAQVYPSLHRMALGLSGRADAGTGIARFVAKQMLPRLGSMRDGAALQRWYHHHAVLTARRAMKHRPDPRADVLVPQGAPVEASYLAFIRALRELPFQQREAYLLHHGEGLDLRQMATAMDCSTKATEVHLQSAEQILRPIAGAGYDALLQRMIEAYAALTPGEDVLLPTVRAAVSRSLWPRRVMRIIRLILLLAVLAAAAWVAWTYRSMLGS